MNTLNAAFLQSKHDAGLAYEDYLKTDAEKGPLWQEIYNSIELNSNQKRLIGSFVRQMKVLVSSGIWCGDCVQQGPLLARIAEASPCIDMRWVDRDTHKDLAESLSINQGLRVPVVIFMAEDYEPVSIMGDRSLTRYRALAAKNLGPSCPMPGAAIEQNELEATLQDWLNEFERVHLLLRISGRFRQKYND